MVHGRTGLVVSNTPAPGTITTSSHRTHDRVRARSRTWPTTLEHGPRHERQTIDVGLVPLEMHGRRAVGPWTGRVPSP